MKKCHRCKINPPELGANVFDAPTGTHITTRWYCMFCARAIGLIHNDTT